MSCRYCYKIGHRARDCKEAATSRAAKALRSSRPDSSRAAAAAPRIHPLPPQPAAPARQPRAPVAAPPGRTSVAPSAAAATAVPAAPSLQTARSPSAPAAAAAAADWTTLDAMDASVSAVSLKPPPAFFTVGRSDRSQTRSWKKQRVSAPGTAVSPLASAPLPADMSVDAGASSAGQDPLSPEAEPVGPPDEGTNQIEPASDG
jgi:hypothetical protein